jgi:hypothetical protein
LAAAVGDPTLAELIARETLAETLELVPHRAPEKLGAAHHSADAIDDERVSIGVSPV